MRHFVSQTYQVPGHQTSSRLYDAPAIVLPQSGIGGFVKLLSVFGTRPEAIKMAPLVAALGQTPGIQSLVCVTGQHREMLDQVLDLFDIRPDIDLGLMQPGQGLNALSARTISSLDGVFEELQPDRVLVHGDTTTAMAAAMAAFQRKIPVGHIEAGLRTYALDRPWPEEMNRRTIDIVSDMLFAPTPTARENLEREALEGRIFVTGNTGIDALEQVSARLESDVVLRRQADAQLPHLEAGKKVLLVTGHRRESFGEGFRNICEALAKLSQRSDIEIVYPVHLNPNVIGPVKQSLSGRGNVHLVPPLDFLPFVRLMQRAHAILTDSGGVQEEAPSLGKPVLVMRDVTERPEAVQAGTARLIGTDEARIVREVSKLFDDGDWDAGRDQLPNPYGDGQASGRIVAALTGGLFEQFAGVRCEPPLARFG